MSTTVTTDQSVNIEIGKFLGLLLKSDIKIKKLILFGSHAKKTAHKWSDVDLAVVSEPFAKDEIDEMVKLLSLSQKASDRIEAIPIREERLASKYDALAGEIKKYGKIVFEQ